MFSSCTLKIVNKALSVGKKEDSNIVSLDNGCSPDIEGGKSLKTPNYSGVAQDSVYFVEKIDDQDALVNGPVHETDSTAAVKPVITETLFVSDSMQTKENEDVIILDNFLLDNCTENSTIFDYNIGDDGELILVQETEMIETDDDQNMTLVNAEEDSENESLASLQRKLKKQKNEEIGRMNEVEEEFDQGTGENSFRWKRKNEHQWKKNKNKDQMSNCEVYCSKSGINRKPKLPKPVTCSVKCKFKCSEKFTEEERLSICKKYWGLKDYGRQKDFLLSNIDVKSPKTRRPRKGSDSKERQNAKFYYFVKNHARIRVCQYFFMRTLSINNGPILTAFKQRNISGTFTGQDNRGKHTPANKISDTDLAFVKNHINSFPKMESHYTRKSTKRMYLDSKLSISKMFYLYKEKCLEGNRQPVSQSLYRKIFCTNFNLSFFVPKKDQCQICWKHGKKPEDQNLTEDYVNHIRRKIDAAKAKELDTIRASNDSEFVSATFDLQSVLQIPCSDVSLMYYTRKINMYNFTIYEASFPNKAYCYSWTELNGKRGSAEIATCLFKWFHTLPEQVKHVSLFSDSCGGQNRNQNVCALMLYLTQTINIDTIEHKFLESGHSYMEVDSMHSAIEKQKKNSPIYVVHDWLNLFRQARSKRNRNKSRDPYIIEQVMFTDFQDFQDLAKKIIKNRLCDTNNEKVKWLKIKCLRFKKDSPFIIEYKYDYFGEYRQLDIRGNKKRCPDINFQDLTLKNLYKRLLPISKQKKADLLNLCQKGTIPEEYHGWYHSLPVTGSVDVEPAPEPEFRDSDEDKNE